MICDVGFDRWSPQCAINVREVTGVRSCGAVSVRQSGFAELAFRSGMDLLAQYLLYISDF